MIFLSADTQIHLSAMKVLRVLTRNNMQLNFLISKMEKN